MSRFSKEVPPRVKFNDSSHFGHFLRVSIEGWPQFTGPAFLGVTKHIGKSGINLGPKVNVRFFRVDPYMLGNRIPQAFHNWCHLHVRCHHEKFDIGFCHTTFWGALCMWGSQEKLSSKKSKKNFQSRPRKKIQKRKKLLLSGYACFEKRKPYLGGLAIFHTSSVYDAVWKIANPHKFWLQFLETGVPGNISDPAHSPQSQFCMLEWSNWPEISVRGLKLEFRATLLSTLYHFDQPLPQKWAFYHRRPIHAV